MSDLEHDPVEDRPKYQRVNAEAEQLAWEELARMGIRPGEGVCHIFWPTKKRILRKQFGVRWRTPAEMNPHVIFD